MRRKRRSRTRCYTRAPDLGQPRAARYPPMSVLFPGSQRTWSQASESSAKRYAARTQIACTSPGASSHQSVSPNSSRAAISNPTRRGILPHTHRRHRPRRVPSLSEASVAAHVKNVVQSRHVTFGDERTERRPRRGLARQLTGNVPNVLFQIHHRPTSSAQ